MSLLSMIARGVKMTKPAGAVFDPVQPGVVSLRKPRPLNNFTEYEDPNIDNHFPENAIDQIALIPGSPGSRLWRAGVGAVRGKLSANGAQMEENVQLKTLKNINGALERRK